MKLLITMLLFDVRMNFKSFMGAYVAVVPIVILLVLNGFLPSVASSSYTLAVVNKGTHAVTDTELIKKLDVIAEIEYYDSIKKMEDKLRGSGSAEGLYWDSEKKQYVSVLERKMKKNKIFSFASKIIRQHYYKSKNPQAQKIIEYSSEIPNELSDRTKKSPVATMGGSIFIAFLIVIGGFVIGLGLVIDKEYGTDQALKVTPLTKFQYFLGKSIYPLMIIAVYTIIDLLVMNLMNVNILQVYAVVILSFPFTLLLGLIVGALANNETESIGYIKLIGMILMLSILGGTLLPENWTWAVWWSPFYWIYDILKDILTETAQWITILWKSGVITLLSAMYFLVLRKKIVSGLS